MAIDTRGSVAAPEGAPPLSSSIDHDKPVQAVPSGRDRVGRIATYLVLAFMAILLLFPLYIAVVFSLVDPPAKILTDPPVLLRDFNWRVYPDAFTNGDLGRYFINSIVMSLAIMSGQLITSVLAAYAFAFLRFPLKRVIFALFLATMMVPVEVIFTQNFQIILDLGWKNSYQGLIVPFLAFGFGTFLLRQAFLAIPGDLRDAAALDGYGHFGFLTRVVVPLAKPMLATLSVFSFLMAWNQYLWPLLVADDRQYRTIQIALQSLVKSNPDQLNQGYAAVIMAFIPLFLLLIFFERQLVRGLTAGAVKG